MYTELYKLAPVGYFNLNEKGTIIRVNEAGALMLDSNAEKLLNSPFSAYIANEDKNKFLHHFKKINKMMSTQTYELKLIKSDDSLLYTRNLSKRFLNKETNNVEILCVIQDITFEKKYEELAMNAKLKLNNAYLSLIEQFTSTTIYELGQPLGVIANYANGCIRKLKKNNFQKEEILYAMEQIIKMTQRTNNIYQRLKNFKCKSNLSFQMSDINELIRGILDNLRYELTDLNINIRARLGIHLPKIMLDKVYIEQIFIYIIHNLIERTITNMRATILMIETEDIGNSIVINIADNVLNFTSATMNELNDVENSIKPFRNGLSFTIIRTVIEIHGGKIKSISYPDGSFCFQIILPIRVNL